MDTEARTEARVAALEHLLAALLQDPKIALNANSAFTAAEVSLVDSSGPGGPEQKAAARDALQEIKFIAGIK